MTKYAVITDEVVVHTADNEYGSIEYAVRTNPGATHLPFVNENELKTDPKYPPGKYILSNVRTTQLFEKITVTQHGLIYSTHTPDLKLLKTWTILVIDDSASESISESKRAPSPPSTLPPALPISKPDAKTDAKVSGATPVPPPLPGSVAGGVTGSVTSVKTVNPPVNHPIAGVGASKTISTKIEVTPIQKPVIPGVSVKGPPPASVNGPSTSGPAPVPPTVKITPDNDPQLMTKMSLDEISTFPQIMSISSQYKNQRDKIEMMINHNIATGNLKEENIAIITDNDKTNDSWNKRYPTCFLLCGKPDDDLLYYLNSQKPRPRDTTISKLVIFDHCLFKEFVEKPQFNAFIANAVANRVAIIVMTQVSDVISANSLANLSKTMLHTFTLDWTQNVSANFIKRYPILKDQKTIENYMVHCIRNNSCIVLNKQKPTTVEMF
ncbi:hypothetical protein YASMINEVIRUS_676 [Yasminevirus sp. GU-2018]|uniref:Uncharacterized protein n=1 Tax=Yasminevirus sp. GU-2018 TaxID=2420051 RepID=A0A5K0U9V9_9VIRU|nr:hypothetical protein YASMINEVIRUS_676 [Yasminevirus sp. GU-2018]